MSLLVVSLACGTCADGIFHQVYQMPIDIFSNALAPTRVAANTTSVLVLRNGAESEEDVVSRFDTAGLERRAVLPVISATPACKVVGAAGGTTCARAAAGAPHERPDGRRQRCYSFVFRTINARIDK